MDKIVGMIMKRPISLIFVALFFIFGGVWSVMDEYIQSNLDFFQLGWAVVSIFTGVGLFQIWRISRWLAFAQILLVIILCLILDVGFKSIMPFTVVMISVASLIFWILVRRNVRELFQHKTNSPTASVSI
jgi:hypothetical protein